MKQNELLKKHNEQGGQRRDSFSALLRKIRRMVGVVFILAGIGIIGSSLMLNYIQVTSKRKAIEEFRQEEMTAVSEPAHITLVQADPDEEPEESTAENQDQDRFAGNILGILRIPSIDSEEPVKEGVTKSSLHAALGHEPETAYPGEMGNCVIAGHRNYTFGTYFNRLNEVQVGDMIYFDTRTETYAYQVSEIQVVEPDDLEILDDRDSEQLTLYTCTPLYIATHRLVVIADRVEE